MVIITIIIIIITGINIIIAIVNVPAPASGAPRGGCPSTSGPYSFVINGSVRLFNSFL